MAETDAERALQYRSSAQHIRIYAQSVSNGTERETLLGLAREFDSLADEIERGFKPPKPEKSAVTRLRRKSE